MGWGAPGSLWGVLSPSRSAPLQMVLQRSSSYPLTLANFSLGEPGPVRGAMGLQSHSVFFTAGTKVSEGLGGGVGTGQALSPTMPACLRSRPQVWRLNVTGPGCRHFSTCQRCLRAERFMGCGWCADGCTRRHECTGPWVQDSCPPVLTDVGLRRRPPCSPHLLRSRLGREVADGVACGGTFALSGAPGEWSFWTRDCHWAFGALGVTWVPLSQFHPRSAPLQGRTRVTLCGMTFRSHPDPDTRRSPPSAYRVAVGQRGCTVLPEESRSLRCVVVPGLGGKRWFRGGGGCPPGPRLTPRHHPADPSPPLAARTLWMCWCVSWSQGAQEQPPGQLRWCSPWRNPPDPPASTSTARPASAASSLWYGPAGSHPGRVWGGVWLTRPPHGPHLCPGTPCQCPAPPLRPPGGWHPPLAPRHQPLSREQLAGDGQRLQVPAGRAAQVRPCPGSAGHSGVPDAGVGTGTPPAVLPSAIATVSPGRMTGSFSAQHPVPVAWAQPGWPCGSTARSSRPPRPSSTARTPPFRLLSPAAAMSECVGPLPPRGGRSWPPRRLAGLCEGLGTAYAPGR